ncbi:MAG: hypothetical protein NC924_08145 [Candidatus Omnitrophica bacterium]|nr:hypothetical protein [Candidatus Omnitrophota bacterium]
MDAVREMIFGVVLMSVCVDFPRMLQRLGVFAAGNKRYEPVDLLGKLRRVGGALLCTAIGAALLLGLLRVSRADAAVGGGVVMLLLALLGLVRWEAAPTAKSQAAESESPVSLFIGDPLVIAAVFLLARLSGLFAGLAAIGASLFLLWYSAPLFRRFAPAPSERFVRMGTLMKLIVVVFVSAMLLRSGGYGW